jgi:hypothetical protein
MAARRLALQVPVSLAALLHRVRARIVARGMRPLIIDLYKNPDFQFRIETFSVPAARKELQ